MSEDLPADPEVFARAVARRVAELRERAGMSKGEFARAIDRRPQYAGRLEVGQNMTLSTLLLICRVLHARPAELFEPPAAPAADPARGRGRPRKVRAEGAGAAQPLRVPDATKRRR